MAQSFNQITFSKKKTELMKSFSTEPLVKKGFYSKYEIEQIMSWRNYCEKIEKRSGVINYKYKNGGTVEKFLLSKVEPIIGHCRRHGGNYFSTQNPFHVHTDTGKANEQEDDEAPYKAIVTPLVQSTHKKVFSTIIFDQQQFGEASHFWRGSVFNYMGSPIYNHIITDYSHLEGFTNKPFDLSDYSKYLSHLPYENLFGLSIKTVLEWEIGDLVLFNCSSLHASNNFRIHSQKKEGLVLFVSSKSAW
jgi:hypothetical protein